MAGSGKLGGLVLAFAVAGSAVPGGHGSAAPGAVLEPGVAEALDALAPGEPLRLLVSFAEGADRGALLAAHGLAALADYDPFPVAYAEGPRAAWLGLARAPGVRGLELDRALPLSLATAIDATRVRPLHEGAVSIGGAPVPLTGAGVGIAVVDTGFDCLHPDLQARCARSLVATPFTVAEQHVPNSDGNGHGTHVAGVALGDGTASAGAIRGVAPGARLYGYNAGLGPLPFLNLASVLRAWAHIAAQPQAPGEPPVRVVSNSFDAPASGSVSLAVQKLVQNGITVVAAASNGGDGGPEDDNVNGLCKVRTVDGAAPLPGVVCVASYSDAERGSAEGGISSFSSRDSATGELDLDVAAPGHAIASARASTSLGTLGCPEKLASTPPLYCTLSGTSFAAPHVAGIVALLQEARARAGLALLAPEEVEATLRATAHPFANYAPYPNRHAGFGLADARAAVEQALGLAPTPMDPALRGFTGSYSGILFTGNATACLGEPVNNPCLLNLGFAGSLANVLADFAGLGEPAPPTNAILPGSDLLRLRAFMDDAGNSPLGAAAPGARVTATVAYESGKVFGPLDFARGCGGSCWDATARLAYAWGPGGDGDVTATFSFDLQGDGVVDPITDGTVTVTYEGA